MNDLEKEIEMCLHQFIRPSKSPIMNQDGIGNCYECVKHEDNKYCKKYCPIKVSYYEIERT